MRTNKKRHSRNWEGTLLCTCFRRFFGCEHEPVKSVKMKVETRSELLWRLPLSAQKRENPTKRPKYHLWSSSPIEIGLALSQFLSSGFTRNSKENRHTWDLFRCRPRWPTKHQKFRDSAASVLVSSHVASPCGRRTRSPCPARG